jgi:hypothetical protein
LLANLQPTASTRYLYTSSWNGWQPCLEYIVSEFPPQSWQRVTFQQISGPAPIFNYAEVWFNSLDCHMLVKAACIPFSPTPPGGTYVIRATVYPLPSAQALGAREQTADAEIRVDYTGASVPTLRPWGVVTAAAVLLISGYWIVQRRKRNAYA